MAKPLNQDLTETHPAALIFITDVVSGSQSSEAGATNTETLAATAPPSLDDVDALFGPLRIGEYTVTRKTLHTMGATLYGKAITTANTYFDSPHQAFIDALEFDPTLLKQRLTSAVAHEATQAASLMYEIATHRSPAAAALFRETAQSPPDADLGAVGKVLDAVQHLDINRAPMPEQLPNWVNQGKTRSMAVVGVGMQLYGLYSAYRGTIEALKQGDPGEAAINLGGGATEITSIGVEYAMTKTGQDMIRQGSRNLELFGKTSAGKWLARSSGIVAAVLTLPFDLYTAIKSFNDAAKAEGKQAQDLYVTGGLSLFSAALSLALGCATLAGLQFAGPIGLVAAGLMIAGAAIYQAARVVDDIDDYIELTVGERWRAGWLAFWACEQDTELMDRFNVAKTYSDYEKLLKSRSLKWLNNELKESFEAVYIGHFEVTSEPREIHRFEWAEGEEPHTVVNMPVIKDTNDMFAAWYGIPADEKHVILGHRDPNKGVFWQLGDGDDQILGVGEQPNHFSLGAGRKRLKAGNKDDTFAFQSAAETLTSHYKDQPGLLDGGNGTDLLWLQGKHRSVVHGANPTPYRGYNVDLKHQRLELLPVDNTAEPVLQAHLCSIEKVETLAGASNKVVGSDQADMIAANGDDTVEAGDGNDHIGLRGFFCRADGGLGMDTYYLHKASRQIQLNEDGGAESLVYLGVSLECVQTWTIQGEALMIHSLIDHSAHSPMREVLINTVYKAHAGKRTLHNAKWLFITEDGYCLQPDLPSEIAGSEDAEVEVLVIVPGTSKTAPVVLNDHREINAAEYYVDRGRTSRSLRIGRSPVQQSCTLYVDFDSSEITGVDATYKVDVKRHINTVLSYTSLSYRIYFTQGRLFIHDPMIENPATKSDMGGGVMSSSWKSLANITLVMRDGVAYDLDFPRNNYHEDAQNPGYRRVESRGSLRERAGRYLCVKPTTARYPLKATPQKISFRAADFRSLYRLEGRSSDYEVYPSTNMSLQLSTVEGSQMSSIWKIYMDKVDGQINRTELNLEHNLLEIGTVHVLFPDSETPNVPLESVYVFLKSGITYKIHSLFDWIELYAIDAAAFPSIPAMVEEIHQHRKYEPNQTFTGTRVLIHNLQLNDAPASTLYYVADTDTWEIDDDRARAIKTDDLTIKKTSSAEQG